MSSPLPHDLRRAVFASDLARDVRSEYEDRRAIGLEVPDATREVFAAFRNALDRPEDGPIVIVALAALQLADGALDATMRDAAMAMIAKPANAAPVAGDRALPNVAVRKPV